MDNHKVEEIGNGRVNGSMKETNAVVNNSDDVPGDAQDQVLGDDQVKKWLVSWRFTADVFVDQEAEKCWRNGPWHTQQA